MKCPKCGAVMYSSGTVRGNYVELKYICSKCGYEVKDNLNDLIHSAPFFQPGVVQQPDISVTNYGWICPKCGIKKCADSNRKSRFRRRSSY